MSQYVTKVRTGSGDVQIDYNALANLPKPDTTLTLAGRFADAKATGDKMVQVSEQITKLDSTTTKTINGVAPDKNGNIVLNAQSVGALPNTYTPPVTSVCGQTGDVTFSSGGGVDISGTTITNSGVRSVATGSSNGTISVNTNGTSSNVAVKGLGSAAYTDSGAYMPKFTFSLSGTTLYITT